MFRTLLITVMILGPSLSNATTLNDIHRLLDELHYTVDQEQPSPQDLQTLERSLRADLDFLRNRTPRLICMKSANGRYYPSNPTDGQIVGDTAYDAGHVNLNDCKMTLPTKAAGLTCFKRANSRYYPTDPATGRVIGSTAYDAGYVNLTDCLSTLN